MAIQMVILGVVYSFNVHFEEICYCIIAVGS